MKIELIEYQSEELRWYYKVSTTTNNVENCAAVFHHNESGLNEAKELVKALKQGGSPTKRVLETYEI